MKRTSFYNEDQIEKMNQRAVVALHGQNIHWHDQVFRVGQRPTLAQLNDGEIWTPQQHDTMLDLWLKNHSWVTIGEAIGKNPYGQALKVKHWKFAVFYDCYTPQKRDPRDGKPWTIREIHLKNLAVNYANNSKRSNKYGGPSPRTLAQVLCRTQLECTTAWYQSENKEGFFRDL